MRLISMHVDDFGGLHNYDYTFEDGLNVILHDNGWGKTTMAAFLKAMLYGFDSRRSKDITENERKRYLPWQGGKYGGSLDFEAEGVKYRVSRTFGETPRFDKVKILNLDTHTVARINPDKIGETLFKLDASAFQRSVFINQNGLSIDGAASSIHTRLNALVSQANDVAAFDDAIAKLTAQIKVYEKTGARGQIGDITRQIATLERKRDELERNIAEQDSARERISQIDILLSNINKNLDEKKKKLDEVSGEAKKREAAKKILEDLNKQIADLQQQMDAIKADLGGRIPNAIEIDQVKRQKQSASTLVQQLAELGQNYDKLVADYNDLLEKYNQSLPTTVQLDEIQGIYGELQGIQSTGVETLASSEEPEGYTVIKEAADSNPGYIDRLTITVGKQMTLQQYIRKLESAERNVVSEQESWSEKKKRYSGYASEVERLQEELEGVKDYAPETVDSVLSGLDDLQKKQRALNQQITDQTAAIQREQESWVEKKKHRRFFAAETARLQADVETYKAYSPEVVNPVLSELEAQQKKQRTLNQQLTDQNAAIKREMEGWAEKKKKYASLKSEAERLQEEVDSRSCYDSPSAKPVIASLEDIQKQQQLVDVRRDELASEGLSTEQETLLARYPGDLPDANKANSVLKKLRGISQKKSDVQGLSAKLSGEQSRADSLKTSIDQLGDVADETPVEEPKKSSGTAMIGAGAAVAVVGAILIFAVAPFMAVLAAVGVALAVFGVVSNNGYKKKQQAYEAYKASSAKKQEGRNKKADVQKQLDAALESVASLKKQIDELNAVIEADQTEVSAWAQKWADGEELTENRIAEIIENTEQVEKLRRRKQDTAEKEKFVEEKIAYIAETLSRIDAQYPELSGLSIADALEKLRSAESDAKLYTGQYQNAKKALESFLKETKLTDDQLAAEESLLVAGLRDKIQQLQTELTEIESARRGLNDSYPEISGKNYDDALSVLRAKAGEYKVAAGKLQTAVENEAKSVSDAKMDAAQLEAEESPLIAGLQEKLEVAKESMKQSEDSRSTFDQAYPDITGMTIEDAVKYLRGKESSYKVINGQLQTALRNLQIYLDDTKLTEAQFTSENSPKLAELTVIRDEASRNLTQALTDANEVLAVLDMDTDAAHILQALHETEEMMNEYKQYTAKLKDQAGRQAKKQQQIERLQNKLNGKLVALQGRYHESEVPERLALIREEVGRAATLAARIAEAENDQKKQKEKLYAAENAVESFKTAFGKFAPETPDVLAEIYAKASVYAELSASVQQLEKQKTTANPAQTAANAASDMEETAIRSEIARIEERRDSLRDEYTHKSDFIRQADQSLEQYPDVVSEIHILYDQKQKAQSTLAMLKRTIQLITKAKENLANRYLSKVEDTFNNYMHVWLNNDAVRGILDIDFNITIEEGDKAHVAEGYSTGTCDLIDFCMRLALVDTLFENEQPFLILDDPFVNLDVEHLDKALELLNVMAANKQLVYFVCHPIRAVVVDENSASREEFVKLAEATRRTIEDRKISGTERKKIVRKSPKEMYKVVATSGVPPFKPAKPNYMITNNIFSMNFVMNELGMPKDNSYELFFIDAVGHVLNDRQLVEVKDGKLSMERVQFCLNTRDDSGDQYELMIRESGQDDYEVVARIPFKAKLAFAGTFSFDF